MSTALASPTTGVVATSITDAAAGTYVFSDAAADGDLTLGNGIVTQTVRVSKPLEPPPS